MSTLPTLKLDKENKVIPISGSITPEIDGYSESYEMVEKMMFNETLTKEYETIKENYSELINVFQKSFNNKPNKIYHKFNSLEDFENSIANGDFDLNKYSIKEINNLMEELEKLEKKSMERNLEDFELKTISDFHKAINNGFLDINKFSIKEINELLNELEDDTPLDIEDYNISLYGDIEIEEIYAIVEENKVNQVKVDKANSQQINSQQTGNSEIDNLKIENSIVKNKKQVYNEVYNDEVYNDIENIDKMFLEKIIDFIKKIFRKKKT